MPEIVSIENRAAIVCMWSLVAYIINNSNNKISSFQPNFLLYYFTSNAWLYVWICDIFFLSSFFRFVFILSTTIDNCLNWMCLQQLLFDPMMFFKLLKSMESEDRKHDIRKNMSFCFHSFFLLLLRIKMRITLFVCPNNGKTENVKIILIDWSQSHLYSHRISSTF